MKPRTTNDFASIPWGGTVVHQNGSRAVCLPTNNLEKVRWYVDECDLGGHRLTDAQMAEYGGWELVEKISFHDADRMRDEAVQHMEKMRDQAIRHTEHMAREQWNGLVKQNRHLESVLSSRNEYIEQLESQLSYFITGRSA